MKTKMTTLVLGSLLLVVGAEAQTWTGAYDANGVAFYPTGKRHERVRTLTSATAVNPVPVSPFESWFLSCVGTNGSTSQTLVFQDSAGNTLSTQSVNCTNTVAQVASATAGTFGYAQVAISPTAGLTTATTVTNYLSKQPAQIAKPSVF